MASLGYLQELIGARASALFGWRDAHPCMSAALATVAADAAVDEEAATPSEKTAASASRRECVVASIAFETGATREHDAGARAASSSAADGRPRIRCVSRKVRFPN